ncbi:MAG TPA: membrane protein insertase YidC [Terriglobales bacterium]|nr:membrane protein insertase YidC [Terriglobales bacterium]
MEQKFLLVFLLMAIAIFGAQWYMKKYGPEQKSSARPNQPTQSTPAPSSPAPPPSTSQQQAVQPRSKKHAPAPQPAATKEAQSESETVIENDLYRITFSNRGAQTKSWILKKYQDDEGHPLDLVNQTAAAKYGYPLSLYTYDESVRNKLNSALYLASETGDKTTPTILTFEYSDGGLVVKKSLQFDKSYVIKVQTSVFQNGNPVYAFPAWPAGFGDQNTVYAYGLGQFEYQYNSKTEHLSYKKVSNGNTLRGSFDWAGASSQYFAAIFIPNNPENQNVVSLRNTVDAPSSAGSNQTKPADALGAAVGQPGETNERLFVGPKSLEVLEAVSVPTINGADKDLRSSLNFGYFSLIARPLFIWLRWTNQYVHNWGWSIVLQTLIITLALFPLRISQIKSTLKMQRVQPQMKAIQEKYKKYSMRDPRKQDMQKEIGELYKREGVNPVGGCLPMLVQLPFLWAYYRMLPAVIDLRQAHWLWIHDLSARDPYLILPIIMVISMFIMQKMMPQAGMDPTQQRMMNIMMPAFMGFIFYNLAAGLNLYYAESNIIMIGQQWVMNQTKLGREMREIAAKRARKKDKKP